MSVEAGREITLQRLRKRLDQLPLLPSVVLELMHLSAGADNYFERVLALACNDPAFAARLLAFANSSYVGAPHPVTTIAEALVRVGVKGAVDLVLAHSAGGVLVTREGWERELWSHCIAVASLMRALSRRVKGAKPDPDKAYAFGLLHDIGRFLLYLEAPETLRKVWETECDSPAAITAAEMSICGFAHAELGYLAAQKWRLPRALASAVRYQHCGPPAAEEMPEGDRALIGLLHDSNWIAVVLARGGDHWRMPGATQLWSRAGSHLQTEFDVPFEKLIPVIRSALERGAQVRDTMGLGQSASGPH